jgi:hypothetical protein
MFTLINNIIDRCFFTLSFIVGIQLPEFIQQYIQRLSGHLNEAQFQLQEFQKIAEQHYQGSLATMVIKYKENTEPSIQSTAELIELLGTRINSYQLHLQQVSETDYINKLYQFITNLDIAIAQATAKSFVLAIPLSVDALATGATIAIVLLIIKELSLFLIGKLFTPKEREVI